MAAGPWPLAHATTVEVSASTTDTALPEPDHLEASRATHVEKADSARIAEALSFASARQPASSRTAVRTVIAASS